MKNVSAKAFGAVLLLSVACQAVADCAEGVCPFNGVALQTEACPVAQSKPRITKQAKLASDAKKLSVLLANAELKSYIKDRAKRDIEISALALALGQAATELSTQDVADCVADQNAAENLTLNDRVNQACCIALRNKGKVAVGAFVVAAVAYGLVTGKISASIASGVVSSFAQTGQVSANAVQTVMTWMGQDTANRLGMVLLAGIAAGTGKVVYGKVQEHKAAKAKKLAEAQA